MDFCEWIKKWMALACFRGPRLQDSEARIEQALDLWRERIDPGWERGPDKRLLDPERRDCRRLDSVRRVGERAIEDAILLPHPDEDPTWSFGMRLVDVVNAVPLTRDRGGRRACNVEADMLLLLREEHDRHALQLIEVKHLSNHAWYAAFENLCQLRFFSEARVTPHLFHARRPDLGLPERLPVMGVVLAGCSIFYEARGQKANTVAPTRLLLDAIRAEAGVDLRLATWDPPGRRIVPL